jgi:hypothetical protein
MKDMIFGDFPVTSVHEMLNSLIFVSPLNHYVGLLVHCRDGSSGPPDSNSGKSRPVAILITRRIIPHKLNTFTF